MMYRWRWSYVITRFILAAGILYVMVTFWLKCGGDVQVTTTIQDDSDFVVDESDSLDYNEITGNEQSPNSNAPYSEADLRHIPYSEIDCIINDDYPIKCRREGKEMYVPFTFINKYFEIYGKLDRGSNNLEHFDWQHSYARVYMNEEKYKSDGIFMSFEHYSVETRDRVKCISGIEGVPVSIQWGPHGYFYPIQIAQYGLSHYSKYLVEPEPTTTTVHDGGDTSSQLWTTDGNGAIKTILDSERHSDVIQFHASESSKMSEVALAIPAEISTKHFYLSLDVKFTTNGSIDVVLELEGKSPKLYVIRYVCSEQMIISRGSEVFYGIGARRSWSRITRDILIDFQKGVALKSKKKMSSKIVPRQILRVEFHGSGFVDNVTLSSRDHLSQFYHSADWLVRNQDSHGGWPITVARKLADGQLKLAPGWYSAMAQGQAMSVLARAYTRTKQQLYLDTALRSTAVFDIPSSEGGVLATFSGRYPWYEEYPTTPSCFVLNGFIYSLIGLYDLITVAPSTVSDDAQRLYNAGMTSLKDMLPLFDTGSGSVYDLRHFTLSGFAPNIARWDYHATHVNQLLLLSTIDGDPLFKTIANRWIGYMKGKRAPHN